MMEIAPANYMTELGMEDSTLFHQYPMDYSLDDFDFQSTFSVSPETESDDQSFYRYFNFETTPNCFPVSESPDDESVALAPASRPTKKLKSNDWIVPNTNTKPKPSSSPSAQLISFEHASQQFYNLQDSGIKPKVVKKGCNENTGFAALVSQGSYEDKCFSNYDNGANQQVATTTTCRNPTQAQEHVIAERKRREKLSRSFIALSAILPGLKKMDKASVLGDAIKYVKQLQEKVQTLEEKAAKKKAGSTVLVKRSIIFTDDIDSSSDDSNCEQPLPEIEVRVCGNDVLIKLQCHKHSGPAATVLRELEKLHLTVHSSSFLPFGNNIVDVTIVAQMKKENCMTAKDLLGSLRQALRQFNQFDSA